MHIEWSGMIGKSVPVYDARSWPVVRIELQHLKKKNTILSKYYSHQEGSALYISFVIDAG